MPPTTPPRDLSLSQARDLLLPALNCLCEPEDVSLYQAGGRILATNIVSPVAIPAYDNAAMDGYAFSSAALDHETDAHIRLRIVGRALAGHPYTGAISASEGIQIMTGAALPQTCDCVVPHELVQRDGDFITVPHQIVRPTQHIRRRAEDLAPQQLALPAGRRLGAIELGLLASLGQASLALRKKLRVAVFSSGDEIKEPGLTLAAAQHYDVNRFSLLHLLQQLGCDVIDFGIVSDSSPELVTSLQQACQQAQVVISSGGISSGVADLIRPALQAMGQLHFHQLAIKPGRPFAYGQIHHQGQAAYLFGLPGNPIASLVCFHFLVRPALLKLMGAQQEADTAIMARLTTPLKKTPGRREFMRAQLSSNAAAQLEVSADPRQGSALLYGLSQANCLIELEEPASELAAGTQVRVHLLSALFN